jgi:hypothetical protein
MRLTFTACAMVLALGAASLGTSAQAIPLASAFPSVAASNANSGFTKVHMSNKHMMMKKNRMMHHHHRKMKMHHHAM